MAQSIRDFAFDTEGIVYGPWNQEIACADDPMDEECCLGVKLAHALDVDGKAIATWVETKAQYEATGDVTLRLDTEDHPYWYVKGRRQASEALGLNCHQFDGLLWMCGAPDEPFRSEPWDDDLDEVWNRLRCIEEMPAWIDSIESRGGLDNALERFEGDREQAWTEVKLHKHADPWLDGLRVDSWWRDRARGEGVWAY